MKSRLYLPASVAAVGIAAFSLVFCRKSEEEDVKKSAAAAPRSSAQSSPLPGSPTPENSRRIGVNTTKTKTEPEKVLTPEEEEKAAASKAQTMFKWMCAFSMDASGAFPPDTSALMSVNVGFPTDQAGDWLRHVIDYRGRNLSTADDGRLVLMRYRIGKRTDKEVRLYVNGQVIVVPSTEPIPEDVPSPLQPPR